MKAFWNHLRTEMTRRRKGTSRCLSETFLARHSTHLNRTTPEIRFPLVAKGNTPDDMNLKHSLLSSDLWQLQGSQRSRHLRLLPLLGRKGNTPDDSQQYQSFLNRTHLDLNSDSKKCHRPADQSGSIHHDNQKYNSYQND